MKRWILLAGLAAFVSLPAIGSAQEPAPQPTKKESELQKLEGDAEKAGDAVGAEGKKVGEDVSKDAKKTGQAVGAEGEKVGKDVSKDAKKAGAAASTDAKKAEAGATKAGEAVGTEGEKVGKGAAKDAKVAGSAASTEAKKVGDDVSDEARKVEGKKTPVVPTPKP